MMWSSEAGSGGMKERRTKIKFEKTPACYDARKRRSRRRRKKKEKVMEEKK